MNNKAVVLLSGGMDSLVCASSAIKENKEVYFLHLNYAQKTSKKEESCFRDICQYYNVPTTHQKIVDMSFLGQIGGSSLTDDNFEVTNYEGDSAKIPSSYVPFRNSIILSLAVSWAEVIGAEALYIGANQEDSPGYPDCREEYYEAFNQVIKLGTKDGLIKIKTPVLHLKKKEIILLGKNLHVPFEKSWSCYKNSEIACGRCDSCALRLRGFREASIKDPLQYEVTK